MPCADSFNDIHELKCGQAGEKLEAGGDEKLIFNFIWPYPFSIKTHRTEPLWHATGAAIHSDKNTIYIITTHT